MAKSITKKINILSRVECFCCDGNGYSFVYTYKQNYGCMDYVDKTIPPTITECICRKSLSGIGFNDKWITISVEDV